MRLYRFSIQTMLLLVLGILSGLVILSSIVSWLAFDRVNTTQEVLLTDSLPAMRFINNVVDDNAELLNLSVSLNYILTEHKLSVMEQDARVLFKKVNSNLEAIDVNNQMFVDKEVLQRNVKKMIENVRHQILLKKMLASNKKKVDEGVSYLLSIVDTTLIDIKLFSSELTELSFEPLIENADSVRSQLNDFSELRFDMQHVRFILDAIQRDNFKINVEKGEDLYRLQIQKISNKLLGFNVQYRRQLASNVSLLNDMLSSEGNVFLLIIDRVKMLSVLDDLQKSNQVVGRQLNETYNNILRNANANLDSQAKMILQVIGASKRILVFAVAFSLVMFFLFVVFFIKPRLINRLTELTNNTQAIAENKYNIDIDTQGNDEISAMAVSLDYFRDQLVEKQEVQRTLADSEKALLTIIDNATEGLFTVDVRGIVHTFNPASESFFGFAARDVIGKRIDRMLPNNMDVFAMHKQGLADFDGNGYVVCQDRAVTVHRDDGEQLFGSLSVSLIDLSGRHLYSCFLRDITEQYKAKKKIEALVEQLMRSNVDLERFAYSCSHDLQEPVRMVLSFSELLKEQIGDDLDEKSSKYLGYILNGANNAKQLIQGILAYSRLDQSSVTKEWVSMDKLCQKVEAATIIIREQCRGEFCWQVDDLRLYVVPSQLEQLLINLITNGFKYNKSDKPLVNLSVANEVSGWLISITDNGIGIDPRYTQRIFEVFNRLASKSEYDGSGIGLSICQKIVEKHGGDIWVESELGQGSQFYIRLPKNAKE